MGLCVACIQGACGSTMLKGANSPYWKRPQFNTLTAGKWDMIIIVKKMIGP